MRIGLISAPWIPVPPPGYGGTERVVDSLARGFAKAGHDVLLAAPSDSTCPVPLTPRMRPSEPADLGLALSELSHIIRAYDGMAGVDIIHDHTLSGPLYAHRPAGVPVVTTIHIRLAPQAVDLYTAIGKTTGIIAISRDQVSRSPEVPVTKVIHHGMDVASVPVGQGNGGYLCFVGRLSPDKGILEAIQIADAAGIPLRISARIQGPEEQGYFDDVVKPSLGPDIEFMGPLSDAEKYELVGGALAFLNPIQWPEPFGLVMIEALATGTPVVGTPFGAAPEIVDHGVTGYLGNVGQLAGFAAEAAGLSREACRAAVEQRFSSARMVADHLALYEQIVGGQPGAVTAATTVRRRRT
jgi:glycosyltransferase involved in cell wall biosynthesis